MIRVSGAIRAGFACAALAGCTTTTGTPAPQQPVRMPSNIASRVTTGSLPLAKAAVQEVATPGSSVQALEYLQGGTLDVGIAMADVTYLAYNGQLEGPRPFDQVRGMALLNLNTLHVLVRAGAAIRSIADLRGARVALGPVGSATSRIAELLLNAYGFEPNAVRTERLPYGETADRLQRGDLDAAFMTQPVDPPDQAVEAAAAHGARLVNVEGPAIDRLRAQYPFLKRALIPRSTYSDQSEPIPTIGVDLVLVCRADLDEDLVYRMMQAYFAAQPGSPLLTDLERAPATPIPLHAGAARYYRQRELSR